MLQIEIASWAPEDRDEVLTRVAEAIKKSGGLPWKLNDLQPARPGMLQIWFDVHANRYWELLHRPTMREGLQELEGFNRWTDLMQFELVTVVEMEEALKMMGKL